MIFPLVETRMSVFENALADHRRIPGTAVGLLSHFRRSLLHVYRRRWVVVQFLLGNSVP